MDLLSTNQALIRKARDNAKNGGELSFNGAMNVNNKKIDIHNQSSFYQQSYQLADLQAFIDGKSMNQLKMI